ncbi:MAG: hypothetical protein IPK19_11080 [Chloroflexi bacterium]|nr:hypothetical protein [Chloroflexota bacterium]
MAGPAITVWNPGSAETPNDVPQFRPFSSSANKANGILGGRMNEYCPFAFALERTENVEYSSRRYALADAPLLITYVSPMASDNSFKGSVKEISKSSPSNSSNG